MARPSVIPSILESLERYLDDAESVYQAQTNDSRQPTLPSTNDGKVNVRAVAQALGLRKTQEKYLFEREELSSLINLIAEGQGLQPIGARTQSVADKAIRERLGLQAKTAKADAQAAVESRAAEEKMLEELTAALAEIETLKAEVGRLRATLELVYSGMLVRVNE